MKTTTCPVYVSFTKTGKAVPLRCGSWNCPICCNQLAHVWAGRTLRQFENGGNFITLTMPGSIKRPERAYELLPKQFDTFRKQLQRDDKAVPFLYIAFVEGQPERVDMPHFHIICNRVPPCKRAESAQTALSRRANDCGFGWEAKLKQIDGAWAAFYVAKYASKVNEHTPKGFRRVRTSQHFTPPKEHQRDSLIMQHPDEKLAQYLMRVSDETGVSPDELLDRRTSIFISEAELFLELLDKKQ